jgi:hypothetical protein
MERLMDVFPESGEGEMGDDTAMRRKSHDAGTENISGPVVTRIQRSILNHAHPHFSPPCALSYHWRFIGKHLCQRIHNTASSS